MPKRKEAITLKVLSKKLNLSISTVSRILNGSISNSKVASDETMRRVKKMAEKHNYSSNPYAVGLKTKQSNIISVFVPKISHIVLASIYEGIDDVASENGFISYVSNTNDEQQSQLKLVQNAIARRVDGVIIGDSHTKEKNEYLELLDKKQVPFILVNRRNEKYPSVTCNDYMGGYLAAKHLVSKGHQNFGILAGEFFASTGVDRTLGFTSYCIDNQIEIPKNRIVNSSFDTNAGYEAGMLMLQKKPHPSAVFAVNDFLAIGFMGAMKKHKLMPGRDIAVVGYNNTPLAEHIYIPLTTIYSPMREMGNFAMKMLLDNIKGKEITSISLNPSLVIRESG